MLVIFLWAASLCSVQDGPDFEAEVAPILERSCLECHGGEKRRGGFSLETRETALEGGKKGPVLTPGDPSGSRMIELVSPREDGRAPRMPRQRDPLTKAEVSLLTRWIEAGATWPSDRRLSAREDEAEESGTWWSWAPLREVTPPKVSGAGNPIDAFIFSKLQDEGLAPNPPADPRTLIRRLTYDLHGLPPTPAEIDAFLKDDTPGATERLIDRLLASPRYGERWGRHWLDVVHYGDSHGYDKDKPRPNAWPYRDWVIRALNEDLPYAEWIRRQLAGDVLFEDQPSVVAATGFIAAGPWDFVGHVELREGTRDKRITRSLDRDDMVMTTMSTFASTTVHCARCHDHKFDPIPQRDYYRLQSVFAGIDRADREYDPDPKVHRVRAELRERLTEIDGRLTAIEEDLQGVTSPELVREEQVLQALHSELAALPQPAESTPSNGYHSTIATEADVTKWVQLELPGEGPIDRIVLVPARPVDFPDTPGFGFPLRFRIEISDSPSFEDPILVADHSKDDFESPGDVPVSFGAEGHSARHVRLTALRLWERRSDWVLALSEMQVYRGEENVARRSEVTALDSIEAGFWSKRYLIDGRSSREVLEPGLPGSDLEKRRDELLSSITTAQDRIAALRQRLRPDLDRERAALQEEKRQTEARLAALPEPGLVYAATSDFRKEGQFRPPEGIRPIHVLGRGDVDQPLEEVGPGALSGLPSLDHHFRGLEGSSEGRRRAALAAWLTDPENPLTWRSIVNRVWQYHFGRGLVDTPNDFGRMGSSPTHPELLDWLAAWFRDQGGSFKALHRLILTSQAYQQSSEHHEGASMMDGGNRFLWRAPRRRLEAEALRDGILAVSGQIDWTMGGPPAQQFFFKDDHSPVYDYRRLPASDPAQKRRSVYRFLVRSVPDPFFECLDAANPSALVAKRTETLTAQHALALLNDPFILEQAKHLAARIQREQPADPLSRLFALCLGREPTEEERELLAPLALELGWPAVTRLILNTNEFLFID
ncbi:MAG: PSD1 and planctomycete cytochrome C domain-containing protein [Planctomycetota bacterium]